MDFDLTFPSTILGLIVVCLAFFWASRQDTAKPAGSRAAKPASRAAV